MALHDYEDNLTSFIQDDDRLVTYKWLSKKFKIHVNIAKDILKQYWEKYRDDKKIIATFLFIGQLKDKSIRIEVVKESNLNTVIDKFIKIDCKHVYSLQNCLKNLELLAFAGEGDFHYSSIKSEIINKSNEDIHSLQYINKKKDNEWIKSTNAGNIIIEKSMKTDCFSKNILKNDVEKCDTKERIYKNKTFLKTELEKKSIISAINKVKPLEINSNTKVSHQLKKYKCNHFFSKTSNNLQKSKIKENREKSFIKETKLEKDDEKKQDNEDSTESVKMIKNISTNVINNNKLKLKNYKDTQCKKQSHSQENILKRKRIITDSDENEFEIIDDKEKNQIKLEEEISESIENASLLIEKTENKKRMKKKFIDKTFKDEDGYLVTKRVQIYEVDSDNEEFMEIEKEEYAKKESEIKKQQNTESKGKKQTTLTNFFKKS